MNSRLYANRAASGRLRRGINEKALIALEVFTGLTAVPCGILLVVRPDGSLLQVAPSALSALARHSPFPDFLIPGLWLASVIGGSMLVAAKLLIGQRPYARRLAMAAGLALLIFEVVEYFAIGFMALQVLEGLVGLLVFGLALRLRLLSLRLDQPTSRPTAA